MVVFKPGHQCGWSALWRPAGDRDIFSHLHCQVCRMLGETPVHLWKNTTHALLMCLSGNDGLYRLPSLNVVEGVAYDSLA